MQVRQAVVDVALRLVVCRAVVMHFVHAIVLIELDMAAVVLHESMDVVVQSIDCRSLSSQSYRRLSTSRKVVCASASLSFFSGPSVIE